MKIEIHSNLSNSIQNKIFPQFVSNQSFAFTYRYKTDPGTSKVFQWLENFSNSTKRSKPFKVLMRRIFYKIFR